MAKKFSILFFILIYIVAPLATTSTAYAQAALDCSSSATIVTDADKAYCQNELNQIEAQLTVLLNEQQAQQAQTGTLKGDVDYLNTQIAALKTKITARQVAIATLKVSINDKVTAIQTLTQKIDAEHASIAQLLRNTNEFDNENIVNLILSDDTLSGFYSDLESYTSIKEAVKTSVEQIDGVKTETQTQEQALETERNAQMDAQAQLETTQKQVAASEAQQKQLLAISKQKESAFQTLADQQKAAAAKIRSALFSLAGISTKIDFGTALEYANEAQAKTGVAPAFLLAILTQESNLGASVGSCYLTDIDGPDAGYGVSTSGKIWTNLMKPTRDLQPFLDITNSLGLDPLKTAVSCPIAGVKGYGGAMGPAQFIASTWVLIKDRVAAAVGVSVPNPWAPRDAFMASALFLSDLGASGTSYSAELRSACKYYGSGGSTCSYGRSVMSIASNIQLTKIDPLQGI